MSNSYLIVALFYGSAAIASCVQTAPSLLQEIPVRLEEHRFFAQPVTLGGDTLTLFIDSGIPGFFLYQPAAEALEMEIKPLEYRGGHGFITQFPSFRSGWTIPPARTTEYAATGEIVVAPYEPYYAIQGDSTSPNVKAGWDGILGSPWLQGRVWTFDYERGLLFLRTDGSLPDFKASDTTRLAFNTNQYNRPIHHMARIDAVVDHDSISLIFDTGASMYLSDTVREELGDGRAAIRESSFIRQSLVDQWRSRHPDWRYFEGGANGGAGNLLEVPEVQIAGHTIGPVWFLAQGPDAQWDREGFFQDGQTDGTLGGSALKHFKRVTVDYNSALLILER